MSVRKSTIVIYTLLTAFWLTGLVPFFLQELGQDMAMRPILVVKNLCQIAVVLLGLFTLRKKADIAVVAIGFVLTYYSTCVLNPESFFTWFNGFRRYFPYLFFIPIVRWLWRDKSIRDRFLRIFERNLYIFLWLQFPCLAIQAIAYGMGDYGGGSLGWYNSGVISQLIYLISFYLMVRAWNPEKGYLANLGDNWILLLLLFPSFLNETKISFIFLILYFVMLIPFDRHLGRRLLVVTPLLFVLLAGSFLWYTTYVDLKGDVYEKNFFKNYVLGSHMMEFAFDLLDSDVDTDDVWESDYARGIKFALLPTLMDRGKPYNKWFGYGVGQFKGGSFTEKTKFAKHYEWLLRGTQTEMFNIIIELGYIGGALLIAFWCYVFRFFKRLPKGLRNRRMQVWLGLNMLMMIMYSPSFDQLPYVIIVLTMCFISSRWKELPAFRKPYLFIPPKEQQLVNQPSVECLPS